MLGVWLLFRFTLTKGVLCGREGRKEENQEEGGGRVSEGRQWCNHSSQGAFLITLTPYHITCVAPAFTILIGGEANTTAWTRKRHHSQTPSFH